MWKQSVSEWRQLYGAQAESDRGHNNRMFTACGNTARDDREQAATVAGNTSEEEMRASQVPSRSTKYNLSDSLFCLQTDASWRRVCLARFHLQYDPWPLRRPLSTTQSFSGMIFCLKSHFNTHKHTHRHTHTQLAEVVSCRWQQTEGHWWFLTPGGLNLSTVTSSFFLPISGHILHPAATSTTTEPPPPWQLPTFSLPPTSLQPLTLVKVKALNLFWSQDARASFCCISLQLCESSDYRTSSFLWLDLTQLHLWFCFQGRIPSAPRCFSKQWVYRRKLRQRSRGSLRFWTRTRAAS